jgi:WD40 repeat protein
VRDPPEALHNVNFPQLQGRQIAFDPTGEMAICLDTDFSVREYHAQSGRVVRQHSLPDRSPPVRIHLSPDGQFLLVVGTANDAIVVNRTSGAVSDYMKEPSTICWGAFRTIRGDLWLESELSRNILMKTAPSAPPLFTLRGSSGGADALAVSRDGRYLAAGSGGRLVWFWDLQRGGPPGKCFGHEGTIDGLLLSADDRTILSRSLDGTARFWHVSTRAELLKLGAPEEWIACIGLNPAGTLLVVGAHIDGHWGLQFHHLAPVRDTLSKNVRPVDAN